MHPWEESRQEITVSVAETKSIPEIQHPDPESQEEYKDSDQGDSGDRSRSRQHQTEVFISPPDSDNLIGRHMADQEQLEREKRQKLRQSSRMDSVFVLANQRPSQLNDEIRKIEQRIGSRQDLFKKMTGLSIDYRAATAIDHSASSVNVARPFSGAIQGKGSSMIRVERTLSF